ncbi:hypothetical protein [Kitasatospora cineracea]|uniref:hypothetical protein n=1 Tax=Kitasatospora cineracea TaxID=88074 RepID=UPI0037FFA7E5
MLLVGAALAGGAPAANANFLKGIGLIGSNGNSSTDSAPAGSSGHQGGGQGVPSGPLAAIGTLEGDFGFTG